MAGANYVFNEHLIPAQAAAEKAMLAEFEAGNYTLENPLVKVNPYLINPLAAMVLFTTEQEVAVTVRVLGKEPEGTMMHTFPKAKEHILPILGLYAGHDNKVEIELYRGAKTTIEIKTEALTGGVPVWNEELQDFENKVTGEENLRLHETKIFKFRGYQQYLPDWYKQQNN